MNLLHRVLWNCLSIENKKVGSYLIIRLENCLALRFEKILQLVEKFKQGDVSKSPLHGPYHMSLLLVSILP